MNLAKLRRSSCSRFLIAAAVFLLFACGCLLGRWALDRAYPEVVIKSFKPLEREGLKWYWRKGYGGFKSIAFDPHLYLDAGGAPIRSLEIDVVAQKHNKNFPEYTMEIYFDAGSGFNEQDCIQVQMELGLNRVYFDTLKPVSRVRVDFFNNTKSYVRLDHITLNPRQAGNLPLFLLVSFCCLLLFVMVSRKRDALAFTGALLIWTAVSIAAGIPFLRDVRGTLTFPYLAAMGLASFLFAAFLMEEGRRKERLFVIALCAAAFCLYFYWAAITPFAEGPDEAMHHDVVYYICRKGVLPAGYDPAVRNTIWGFSYAYYPILPYIIGGYLEFVFSRIAHPSWMQLVLLARMVSVVSGTLTVFFAYRLAGLMWKKRPIRYLLPVFVAFLPELAFINTYINSDAMAIMTTSMILYFWASGCEHDWRTRDAAGLSVAMGLCALTYYNCYGFILMSIPLFFYTISLGRRDKRETARTTALIVCLTLAVCGWWFIRNAILYKGDILARRTLNEYAELYAQDGYKPSQVSSPKKEGISLWEMLTTREWIRKTLRSFIAMFSAYSLRAKHFVYVLYKGFLGVGLLGALAAGIRRILAKKSESAVEKKRTAFWISTVLALLIVLALAVYYSYNVDFQPQGRYILPCVLPLGCLLTAGFGEIARILPAGNGKKQGTERVLAGAGCTFCACIMMNILLDTVFHFYIG